jgi:translocation and assembly module TamB
MDEAFDLQWIVESPDLNQLWPGLAGSLNAEGSLLGSIESPEIKARIHGVGLGYQENRIETLKGDLGVGLGTGGQWLASLSAKGLETGGMQWDQARLKLDGTQENHQLKFNIESDKAPQASVALDAALDADNRWSGRLQQLSLSEPDMGSWELSRPAEFDLSADAQKLDQTCLVSGDSTICSQFEALEDGRLSASLEGQKIALERFQRFLPEQLRLDGVSNLTAEYAVDDQGEQRGSLELNLPQGGIGFPLADGNQRIDVQGSSLQAGLDSDGVKGQLDIPMSGLGGLSGSILLPGFKPDALEPESQPLAGRLSAKIDDLSMLSQVLPNLQNIRGGLTAEFDLSGMLGRPGLKGMAELRDGAMDIPLVGLELRDMNLQLQAPDMERVTLVASVSSGEGQLKLEGETRLSPEEFYPTRLQIRGEDWTATNTPDAEIHISPDLTINHTKQRTDLKGLVKVPYARIRPKEVPEGAVSNSPDLIVKGKDVEEKEEADLKLHSDIRLQLGKRVHFNGMGLRARLSGELRIVDEPGRQVIGNGRIGVSEGVYQAYGQDLNIQRGFVLFADSPVDNPGLDIQAIREAGEVTAGVRVSGTLKQPSLKLFSTPAMTETETLSYLLTGRAPGSSGGEQMGLMALLKSTGAGSVTEEIGRQLGLEELRLESEGNLAEASVVAGTYLSPRLYVQYVNALATNQTSLRLRYDLSRRWQVQTESGPHQAVDLFYTIEH